MKKLLAVLFACTLAAEATAQTAVLAIRQREVCDLVTNFSLSQTVAAGNGAKFNAAALASRTNRFPFTVPGGLMPLDETLVAPGRSGWSMLGNGYSSRLHDNLYTDAAATAYGGAPSRVVWYGDDGATMIRDPGISHIYQGMHLQGRSIPGNGGLDTVSWVHAATNATPIVVTTLFLHGLSDGDVFHVRNVTGNTAANGDHYVDVLSTSTVALYSDAGLTTPVAGNGTYTNAAQTASWYGPQARIGIHVQTQEAAGNSVPTGKHTIRDTSFAVPVGILFGKDMTDAYEAAATYDGDAEGHADETDFDNLRFDYPFYIDQTEERTPIYFRNVQAVGMHVKRMTINGCPNEGIYVERGGVLTVDYISLNGNTPRGLIRTGNLNNLPVKVNFFNVDGGSSESFIGRSTMLLNMDRHSIGGQVYMRGKYRPALGSTVTHTTQLPQYLCRGACYVELEVDGLIPGSIQLVGQSFGSAPQTHRLCHVHIKSGSKLYHTNDPTELIAASGNVAPYLLTWEEGIEANNVTEGAEIFENQPIHAGAYTAQMGDVTFAP